MSTRMTIHLACLVICSIILGAELALPNRMAKTRMSLALLAALAASLSSMATHLPN